ncbi:DNA-binding transcriptional MerR regulator [Streptomyces sp. SAI-135]|uniref:MerR family transcriptional regulator n=1 Tax=unclassified Streptomyces TaxID=2593676 RepID=UPI002474543F|nr:MULTISPECIES: MerR family transcriptional regulator [unclassified Streptomyces]MDH6521133.1 DNA-binding transcriptional MerR regulator [Streptomyces sp. SAI-090]MDH6572436.1 DNA-binding transcriptional MerR regulator [Streptomyces sp. SAI-117]MDH6582605.1 DNA-binding transcriptional MerR regulator [Streptomyces sp. SAI-133]MDH6614773.1 DNA-binding transcriptional MerR regulator [Streptomyces sp. SAI-135]
MSGIPDGARPVARPEPASPDTATSLTTGALARRLGVSPTTLRSWDRRYGIGPAVRTDGRHRRWTPRDIAVLEAMCRFTSAGVPPAEAARAAKESAVPGPGGGAAPSPPEPAPRSRAAGTLPLGDVRQECRGLARAAVRLDAPAVEEQLTAAVETHGLAVAWQEVMVPTLHAVGRKWASSGDRYVEVEHLLSWHMSTALRRCTRLPARRADTLGPGPVVLACVPGEQHTLALEALNAGLAELRLPTRMFGAAVPVEALTAAVDRLGPAAVVLWAQARSTASLPLARHIAGAQWGVKGARRRPVVMLGGPGWLGRPGQGMLRPTGLQDALDTLAGLYGAEPAG